MSTYEEWPLEFVRIVEKIRQPLLSAGFRFDYEELFEQLGIAVLVLKHKVPTSKTNLLGLAIYDRLARIPYKKRKELIRRLSRFYVRIIRSRDAQV